MSPSDSVTERAAGTSAPAARRVATRADEREANSYICWFDETICGDVATVGGKNASLGEMIAALKSKGIRVPDGFAVTTHAYREFVRHNRLEEKIRSLLGDLKAERRTLAEAGGAIRDLLLTGEIPERVAEAIREAYHELSRRYKVKEVDVAVRSSATAEDMPEASFAGQLETLLNVSGEKALLDGSRRCFASLFTDRAIAYRVAHELEHLGVAVSVGVQKMVRSDRAGAGVLFTLDTDSGFPDVILINASWGLGENVVQGAVNPDQYTVFKPFIDVAADPIIGKRRGSKEKKMIYASNGSERIENVDTTADERASFVLRDEEIVQLARWAVEIEKHYDRPMDIEWATDGDSGEVFIVQARPETVQSRAGSTIRTFRLTETGERLVSGLAIGRGIASGKVQVIESAAEIDRFTEGAVLVTRMTDPDWVPIMRRAQALVTDLGGRTSHAAIVSRELGIPAVVGTSTATRTLADDREVTVSCAEGGEGFVYDGRLEYEVEDLTLADLPETKTRIMMNVAAPDVALSWWRLPSRGVGLARMEYLINNVIQVHPLALTRFDTLESEDVRRKIDALTRGFRSRTDYFVETLARGIATIAAAQHHHPVIVRMSDFKTNEYAGLIGGRAFEPVEENPMLGWRGAVRYYSEGYKDGFALECEAIRRVRNEMNFKNVIIMIPFCRTPAEADRVLEVLAENGLERGRDELQVYVMAEIPSNVLEAEEFAERFDGFSIGSNDLTQLTLGVDRDAEKLAALFDESEESVKRLIRMLIEKAHAAGKPVGLCGQAPSDNPDFARFLVEAGIDSISVTPDSMAAVIEVVAKAEASG